MRHTCLNDRRLCAVICFTSILFYLFATQAFEGDMRGIPSGLQSDMGNAHQNISRLVEDLEGGVASAAAVANTMAAAAANYARALSGGTEPGAQAVLVGVVCCLNLIHTYTYIS